MALLQTIGWKISKKSRQQQSLHRTHFDRGHGAGGSNNDTVFDGIEIPSGQGIVFYGNGVTFQGHLPNYLSYDRPYRSFRLYLTFVDCHRALIASIYKARLILFELKQRAFSLKSGRIVLDGTPRRLDEDFVKDMHRLEESLVRPHCVGTLLDRLLSAHLRLHPRYEKESGESPVRLILVGWIVSNAREATLQTSLLGVDKAFRMHVVEPLKSALVDSKNEPDYGRLHATNKGLQRLALVTCRQWSDSVGKMGDEIKGKSLKSIFRGLF